MLHCFALCLRKTLIDPLHPKSGSIKPHNSLHLISACGLQFVYYFMVEYLTQATVLTGLNKLDSHPSIQWVEAKTKVKPSFIALGLSVLLTLLLAVFSFDKLVLCIAAYIVPAYFTLLAM